MTPNPTDNVFVEVVPDDRTIDEMVGAYIAHGAQADPAVAAYLGNRITISLYQTGILRGAMRAALDCYTEKIIKPKLIELSSIAGRLEAAEKSLAEFKALVTDDTVCRDGAVSIIDGRRGYAIEFSPDQEAQRAEYDSLANALKTFGQYVTVRAALSPKEKKT